MSSQYESYRPRELRTAINPAINVAINQPPPQRVDARSAAALRPLYLRISVVKGAAGSAYMEIGRTKLIVSVYGPRWSKRLSNQLTESGQFVCDVKYAPCSQTQRNRRGQSSHERAASQTVTDALIQSIDLQSFQKCAVEAFILILEDDGGCIEAAITATSLALADAAVQLRSLTAATSVSRLTYSETDDSLDWSDCNSEELELTNQSIYQPETKADATAVTKSSAFYPFTATLSLAYQPHKQLITLMQESGRVRARKNETDEGEAFNHLIDQAIAGCEQLIDCMKNALREGFKRKTSTLAATQAQAGVVVSVPVL